MEDKKVSKVEVEPTESERFERLAKGLIGVPKSEVEDVRREKKEKIKRLHGEAKEGI